MKSKSLLVTSVAFISLLGAAASYAKPAPLMHGKQHGHYKSMIAHLQPAQKQKLKTISAKLRKKIYPLEKRLHTLRISLDGKIVDHDTQWKDIKPIVGHMDKIHQQMFNIGTKARLEAYKATGLLLPPRVIAHSK